MGKETIYLRQAGRAHLPWWGREAIYLRQVVRQLLPRQVLNFPLGKQAVYLRQAVRHSPSPGEGSNLSQAGSQAGALLPLGEGSRCISGRKSGSYFPGRCSSSLWGSKQFISGRQSGRCSPSPQGRKQFSSISGRQSGFPGLPGGRQAGNSPSPRKEAVQQLPQPPRQVLTFPLLGKTLPKQVSQAVKVLGQAGNTLGAQPGKGPSRLPRGTALPPRQTVLVPGVATPHLTPLIGSLKGLPQKTPTLSGSLTYPPNL